MLSRITPAEMATFKDSAIPQRGILTKSVKVDFT
jgi:hypothetical protein